MSLAFFGKVIYPRFLVFMVFALLMPLVFWLCQWRRNSFKIWKMGLLGIVLIWLLYFDSKIITDPVHAPLPEADRLQYLTDWPAGYGIAEVVKYIDQEIRENIALLNGYLVNNNLSIPYSDLNGSFATSGTIYIGTEAVTYTGNSGTGGSGALTGCSTRTRDYPSGYPIFQGPQTFPELTAIYQDEDNQDKVRRIIDKEVDGSAIPTYKQAYNLAQYHGRKSVQGNTKAALTGLMDSLKIMVGDVVAITHSLPGWIDATFRVVEASESEDEEVEYSLELYNDAFYSESDTIPSVNIASSLPNPWGQPDNITELLVTEDIFKGQDGSILSRLTVTYTPPVNMFYAHSLIQVKVAAESYYREVAKDYSHGVGIRLDQITTPYNVGETVSVRVLAVTVNNVPSDSATALTWDIVTRGKFIPPSDVTGFNAAIEDNGIRLRWAHVSDIDIWGYEIRQGASWDAGIILATGVSKNTYFWRPAQGTSSLVKFWIKAIDTSNIYSTNATMASINILAPGAVTNLTQQVVDNNVLLKWAGNPGIFPIDQYEIRKGDVYASATIGGFVKGTFSAIFEMQAGTYKYWVTAVDTAGLYGTLNSTTATVSQPPDFQLQANWDDKFTGTKTNIQQDLLGNVFACVNTTETFEQHFTNNSNTTFQDFIDDGKVLVAEPTLTTATYERIFDYGSQVPGTMVSMSLDKTFLKGTLTITPKISVRLLDTDPWIDYTGVWQVFANNFRYVKARLDFSGTGENLAALNNLNLTLSVKLQNDAGNDTISDATNGKIVRFTKDFVDVHSIGVTANATAARIPIYDFTDNYATTISGSTTTLVKVSTGEGSEFQVNDWIRVPLPGGVEFTQVTAKSGDDLTVSPALSSAPGAGTSIYHASFRAYLFDTSGTKVTGAFSWAARGY